MRVSLGLPAAASRGRWGGAAARAAVPVRGPGADAEPGPGPQPQEEGVQGLGGASSARVVAGGPGVATGGLRGRVARPSLAAAALGLHGLIAAGLWHGARQPLEAGLAETPVRAAVYLLQDTAAAGRAAPPLAVLPTLPAPPASPLPRTPGLAPPEVAMPAEALAPVALPVAPGPEPASAPSTPAPAPAGLRDAGAATSPAVARVAPPAAAAAGEPAPRPSRQGADHRACARAPYPAALRERGIEGELRLRVHVAADGRAAEVQLLASSGWRLFDESALAQVRACRFRPAQADGQAVADWVEFPVRFLLDG